MARYVDLICPVNVKVPASAGGHPLAPPAPTVDPDVLTTNAGADTLYDPADPLHTPLDNR